MPLSNPKAQALECVDPSGLLLSGTCLLSSCELSFPSLTRPWNHAPFTILTRRLDDFRVGRGAGFPDHPHRGQTTVTYMLGGAVEHEDFIGNRGK